MRGASLAIEGTEFDDSIEFARGAPEENLLKVLFNGTWYQFQRDKVTQINISTLAGPDTIILGPLDISANVRGGRGNDTISGGNADDVLDGQGGFDYVFGRNGHDLITGGLQGDEMIGGGGDDVFYAGSTGDNDDTVTGGPGHDIVDYSGRTSGIHVSVETEPDPETVVDSIYPDVEVIIGGQGNDTIINATRFGIELRGGPGNDTIRGGSGNDTLIGGPGRDLLYGYGGRDHFSLDDGQADTAFGGSGGDSADADALDVLSEIP
jgi:Ca2+-binding RTX toxin-like protein